MSTVRRSTAKKVSSEPEFFGDMHNQPEHQPMQQPQHRHAHGGGKHLKELAILHQHYEQQTATTHHSTESDQDRKAAALHLSFQEMTTGGKQESVSAIPETRINPLDVLPEDVFCRVTCFLKATELAKMRQVNRTLSRICSTNAAGWEQLCERMWKKKANVLASAKANKENCMQAYQQALHDAQTRNHITEEELCSCVWSFRFKQSAGSDWTSNDPWYNGQPCRKVVFRRDGSVHQYYPPLLPSSAARPSDHQSEDDQEGESHSLLFDPPGMTMEWRFLTKPMDLPVRPWGSYVRFKVAGRDVPTYSVRRSPTGNWGFVMESCWGLYASFELPPRRLNIPSAHVPAAGSRGQEITPRRRRLLRRTEEGLSVWVDTASEDNDEESELRHNEESEEKDYLLQDDSSLLITNDVQWREAFLYNVGARVLPEGEDATDEFDQAWGWGAT